MAVLIDALEKKGVRFDEASFKNQDISHLNKHVVVLRGDARKLCDCLFECNPCSVTTHHTPKDMGLLLGSPDSSRRTDGNICGCGDVVVHSRCVLTAWRQRCKPGMGNFPGFKEQGGFCQMLLRHLRIERTNCAPACGVRAACCRCRKAGVVREREQSFLAVQTLRAVRLSLGTALSRFARSRRGFNTEAQKLAEVRREAFFSAFLRVPLRLCVQIGLARWTNCRAKRMECVQLAAAVERPAPTKAPASCTLSRPP